MQKLWGGKVSDLGFGNFLSILKYACQKRGKQLISIDRFYPSSKQCHKCLAIDESLTLKEREWTYPCCASFLERDLNAALNIERVGLETRVGTSTYSLGSVRLSHIAVSA